ncbi:MAG: hypothetical protein DMF06_04365 [Verrucomicrobia bacterium]|nr:MAG: hypothetical protein DMF06_04365 [Verrucomicrobiota bacterium]
MPQFPRVQRGKSRLILALPTAAERSEAEADWKGPGTGQERSKTNMETGDGKIRWAIQGGRADRAPRKDFASI